MLVNSIILVRTTDIVKEDGDDHPCAYNNVCADHQSSISSACYKGPMYPASTKQCCISIHTAPSYICTYSLQCISFQTHTLLLRLFLSWCTLNSVHTTLHYYYYYSPLVSGRLTFTPPPPSHLAPKNIYAPTCM